MPLGVLALTLLGRFVYVKVNGGQMIGAGVSGGLEYVFMVRWVRF